MFETAFSAALAVGAVSVVALVLRFRRAGAVQRQQIKWFAYGAALSIPLGLFPQAEPWGPYLELLGAALQLAGLTSASSGSGCGTSTGWSTGPLVYGLPTVLLGAVYAGLVLALGQLSGGRGRAPSWAVAGATLAVAALFQPARRRVQQVVDLRFNRRKYDAVRTIERFSAPPRPGGPGHAVGRAAGDGRPDDAAGGGVVVAAPVGRRPGPACQGPGRVTRGGMAACERAQTVRWRRPPGRCLGSWPRTGTCPGTSSPPSPARFAGARFVLAASVAGT